MQSLTVVLDSVYSLQTPLDYELDARQGCVRLSSHFRRLFRYRDTLHLWVHVQYVPLYVSPYGGVPGEPLRPQQQEVTTNASEVAETAPKELRSRGRLVRGLVLQSGSGLSMYSGLDLSFGAEVGSSAEVGGRIVTDHLPWNAAGSSISLQEAEQFSLHVQTAAFRAEIGELMLQSPSERSWGLTYLHGVKAAAHVGGWEAKALLGAARSVPVTVEVTAVDGVAGPYPLRPSQTGVLLPIVPGSERVWVDGVLQERGEDKDYVIDYWRAELTFRPRRPVSSASQIVVEFSVLEDGRTQTVAGVALSSPIWGGHRFGLEYAHRLQRPLENRSGITRVIVQQGGSYGIADGADWVGADSVSGRGRGWYRRRDTAVNGITQAVWEYAPGAPDALYMVTFSFVGDGEGDYEPVAPGVYRYVGPRRGRYAPVKLFPLPSQHRMWTFRWRWEPTPGYTSEVEWKQSHLQPHLSRADVLRGAALTATARYSSAADTAAAWLMWEGSAKLSSPAFMEVAPPSEEALTGWEWKMPVGLLQAMGRRAVLQQRLRAQSGWARLEVLAGWLYREPLSALRWGGVVTIRPSSTDSLRVVLGYGGGHRDVALGVKLPWHSLHSSAVIVSHRWQWSAELRGYIDRYPLHRRVEGTTQLEWPIAPAVSAGIRLFWHHRWQPGYAGGWHPASWLLWQTPSGRMQLQVGWNILRDTAAARQSPWLQWKGSWSPSATESLQWRYETGTEVLGAVLPNFLRVLPGHGAFRYRGDLNGNGLPDASEFEQAPFGGDYVMIPTQFGSTAGTIIRAEGAYRFAASDADRRHAEVETRLSFLQKRYPSAWWHYFVPTRATGAGTATTQWNLSHRYRRSAYPWQWGVSGEWLGTAFWTGGAWEQSYRTAVEGSLERALLSVLRLGGGFGPMWERRWTAWGHRGEVTGLQCWVELPWSPRAEMLVTPRLSLFRGRILSAGSRLAVTNVGWALTVGGRPLEQFLSQMTVRYGWLVPKGMPTEALLGGLFAGWWLQGELSYETGATVWSLSVAGTQLPGRPWWNIVTAQVQVIL